MFTKTLIVLSSVALMAATPQQKNALSDIKVVSVQIVHSPGDMIHFECPGAEFGTYHVFIQKPDGHVAVAIGDMSDYGDHRELNFDVPRDFANGDYRVIGASFFDRKIDFDYVFHVDNYGGLDKMDADEAAYVQRRVAALAK